MLRSAIILSVLFLFSSGPASGECHETVRIDSMTYSVGSRWCGKKLDTTLFASPSSLVRIPSEYCMNDYRIYVTGATRKAFVEMARSADKDGIKLIAESGYRSSRYQRAIIKRRMEAGHSFEQVMKYVAPPGYSEHETGRALDLATSNAGFVNTEAYKWLKHHGAEFGFSETYPKERTGNMPYEPWHWCYKREN
ncbi:MAG TPA: M15 family metallopeptidase [candidate division Zixibacteria bacterium]|nr:M15 family metallopeptidase [candidate division Zixibacteria bacterium]